MLLQELSLVHRYRHMVMEAACERARFQNSLILLAQRGESRHSIDRSWVKRAGNAYLQLSHVSPNCTISYSSSESRNKVADHRKTCCRDFVH